MNTLKRSCLVLATTLAACGVKDSNFLNLQSATQPGATQAGGKDDTPPVGSGFIPALGLPGPVSTPTAQLTINDLVGLNGVTPSGVNPSKVFSNALGRTLIVTESGNSYSASLAGLPDGVDSVLWSAADNAGNGATFVQPINLKLNGPAVSATLTTAPTVQITGPTATIGISGTIIDKAFGSAVVTINRPGTSGSCSGSDVTLAPQGTAAGNVSSNTIDVTSSVKANNGAFTVSVTASNAATTSSVPVTNVDCFHIDARDVATSSTGTPQPNVSIMNLQVTTTSTPTSATPLAVSATYSFTPSESQICFTITTTPPRAGSTYTAAVSGPGGGKTLSGVLDNSGTAVSRTPITAMGAYTVSVFVGSLTASVPVNVSGPGSPC